MKRAGVKRVVVIEINVYEGMYPLVCGYLQGYAQQDEILADRYEFVSFTASRRDSIESIAERVSALDGDVYAFSCYVWNMGVMKTLMPQVAARHPNAKFVLGGPQVMHHADRYLGDGLPADTVVCNGEGEITFTGILRQLLCEEPDFDQVDGVSFRQNGLTVTTDPEPRITDLDSIPSPFLGDLFDGTYRMTVLETNRGCPYSCGFCYWGAANNSKIHRFDDQRVRDEITWLSEHGVPIIHLADANWGILKRDVGLSRHMVDCKAANMRPLAVIFAGAKNKPERVAEITHLFHDSGMVSTQPISMQSLDETTLEKVDRRNIKLANFAEVQADLNDRGLGSFIELIWPLPGETIDSFKAGVEELCSRLATTVIVYAHMLLHNTPMYDQREEHGLVTSPVKDDAIEAEMIIQTNDASYEDYIDGLWFIYAMVSMHNAKTIPTLERYLHETGTQSYTELYSEFGKHLRASSGLELQRFCVETIEANRFYEFTVYASLYQYLLDDERIDFSLMLRGFLSRQPWWADENAQVLFELDMLLKPMLYRSTSLDLGSIPFEHLKILTSSTDGRFYEVLIPAQFVGLVTEYLPANQRVESVSGDMVLRLDHDRGQVPHFAHPTAEAAADYRNGIMTRVAAIMPETSASLAPRQRLTISRARKQLAGLRETLRER